MMNLELMEGMSFEIIEVEQGDPFYDEAKTNNGGGYNQPIIRFNLDGIEGVFRDMSCVDFGTHYHLEWDRCTAAWGDQVEVEYVPEYNSDFDPSNVYHQFLNRVFDVPFMDEDMLAVDPISL